MSQKILFPFLQNIDAIKIPNVYFIRITEEEYINRPYDEAFISHYAYDTIMDTFYNGRIAQERNWDEEMKSNLITVIDVGDKQASSLAWVSFLELVFYVYAYLFEFSQKQQWILSNVDRVAESGMRRIMRGEPIVETPMVSFLNTNADEIKFLMTMLKNNKMVSALIQFRLSYQRDDTADSVLDLCATLEAFFNVSDEHSLKVALFAYHFANENKFNTLTTTLEMYQHRNNIIHGNSLPVITFEQSWSYIDVVAQLLIKAALSGSMPNANELEKQVYSTYHD